jgi:hypothetical protein
MKKRLRVTVTLRPSGAQEVREFELSYDQQDDETVFELARQEFLDSHVWRYELLEAA